MILFQSNDEITRTLLNKKKDCQIDDEEIIQTISSSLPPRPGILLTRTWGLGLQVSFDICWFLFPFIYIFSVIWKMKITMSVSWRMLLARQKWKLGKKGKYRKEGPTYIVFVRVTCSKNSSEDVKVKIGYVLRRTDCWEEYLNIGESYYTMLYKRPE